MAPTVRWTSCAKVPPVITRSASGRSKVAAVGLILIAMQASIVKCQSAKLRNLNSSPVRLILNAKIT